MVGSRVSRRQEDLPEDVVEVRMVRSKVSRRQEDPPEDLVEVKVVKKVERTT